MIYQQLELDFSPPIVGGSTSPGQVVDFSAFSEARLKRKEDAEHARLLAEIVKSVEHITGRSKEAEAM